VTAASAVASAARRIHHRRGATASLCTSAATPGRAREPRPQRPARCAPPHVSRRGATLAWSVLARSTLKSQQDITGARCQLYLLPGFSMIKNDKQIEE
jgi:hypothetical protein